MSMKEILKDIVENTLSVAGDSFRFYHGDKGFQNLESDEKNYPAVYLDEPIQNEDIIVMGGAIYEKYMLVLVIPYLSDLEWTPEQHDVVIQKARLAKNQLLSKLNSDPRIKEISNIKTLEFINMFDVNCSGVTLSLYLTPQINNSVCV